MDEEKIYRQKVLKIGAGSIGLCLLVAYWYATQSVAAECNYHGFLGGYLEIFGLKIYAPYKFYIWKQNELLVQAIPQLFKWYGMLPYLAVVIGGGFTYLCAKNMKKETTHGSASFATKKEIDEAGLGQYEDKSVTKERELLVKLLRKIFGVKRLKENKILKFLSKKKENPVKTSGVVVGVNPYTKKLMLHNGVEHILLVAPTRSGKGVNTIIPTGLVWRNSIFFFDVKGELWQSTSSYR